MKESILVAYATQHGSTREVAQRISEILVGQGLVVELRSVHEVENLDNYRAVILGAPFYMGRWLRDARRFLKQHRAALSTLPVAIFALGPRSESPEEIREVRSQLDKALASAPWIKPVEVCVFGGKVDPTVLHFPFNHMEEVDARNWGTIGAFAQSLSGRLLPPEKSVVKGMS